MLHLVAFGPVRTDRLAQLAQACSEGDVLVLLGDAVWFSQTDCHPRLHEALPAVSVHVLEEDLRYAGLAAATGDVQVVSYDGFVALTETQSGIASWYP